MQLPVLCTRNESEVGHNIYHYFLSDIPTDIKFFQVDMTRMGTYFSKSISRPDRVGGDSFPTSGFRDGKQCALFSIEWT